MDVVTGFVSGLAVGGIAAAEGSVMRDRMLRRVAVLERERVVADERLGAEAAAHANRSEVSEQQAERARLESAWPRCSATSN